MAASVSFGGALYGIRSRRDIRASRTLTAFAGENMQRSLNP